MNPVRNYKLMKSITAYKVELTTHHKQPFMSKVFCF